MESELAACPVCGRLVHNDTITLACTGRYSVDDPNVVNCPYFLDVGDDTDEVQSARNARLIKAHNTLARRAAIGRLVEQLTDACRVVPMIGKGEDLLTELRARVEELTDGR